MPKLRAASERLALMFVAGCSLTVLLTYISYLVIAFFKDMFKKEAKKSKEK